MAANTRRVLLGLLLCPALMPACTVNPATGRRELIIISSAQEIALGAQAAPQFEREFGGKVPDEALQRYVSRIGQTLAAKADRKIPYEFSLLNSHVPNAFALPGGKIYVTAGLMATMTNERQLAAVLGHEVAHVSALHNVKALQRQLGVAVLASLAAEAVGGRGAKAAETATRIVGGMLNLSHSREHEYEADRYGMEYMTRVGRNPWGMVELLTALENLPESGSGKLPEIFQTHPYGKNRIERARKMLRRDYGSFPRSAPDPHARRFLQMRDLLPASSRGSK